MQGTYLHLNDYWSPEREVSLNELSNLPEFLERLFVPAEPLQRYNSATHYTCADFRNYAYIDRRGGAVDIGTALAPGGRVFFSVPDTGKGFSIFQIFQTNLEFTKPLLSVSTGLSFPGVKAAVACM